MDHRLIEALAESLVPVIRDAVPALVKAETAPLSEKLAELEAREPEKGQPGEKGEPGINGKDVDPDELRGLIAEQISSIELPRGDKGEPGTSITLDDVRPLIDEAVKALPPAEPGKDAPPPTTDQVLAALKTMDADVMIRKALTSEAHKGGIDVLAPDDVSQEMTNAVQMLAEPFPTKAIGETVNGAKPRSFRFERDAQNRIVAAHQE